VTRWLALFVLAGAAAALGDQGHVRFGVDHA
jgi:hypothetical protein